MIKNALITKKMLSVEGFGKVQLPACQSTVQPYGAFMELPEQIGVMILNEATLFPQSMLPLFIFEQRYRRMLADSLGSHRMFCIAMQKPDSQRESPVKVAGLGLVRAAVGHEDGTSHMVLEGNCRVRLGRVVRYKPYRVHEIECLPTRQPDDDRRLEALTSRLRELIGERLDIVTEGAALSDDGDGVSEKCAMQTRELMRYMQKLRDPEQLADMAGCALLTEPEQRQRLLETQDLLSRLQHLNVFLTNEILRLRKPQG